MRRQAPRPRARDAAERSSLERAQVRHGFLVALALVLLPGCGHERTGSGTAALWVTRDRGATVLAVETVPAGLTAMQALDRELDLKTTYGGRFVQSIEGIEGDASKQRDWFWFLNGIEADRSAADYRLHAGDVEWWDFRSWNGEMREPVVVGAFPEPFLHGYRAGAAGGGSLRAGTEPRRPCSRPAPARQLGRAAFGPASFGRECVLHSKWQRPIHGFVARSGRGAGSPVQFTFAGDAAALARIRTATATGTASREPRPGSRAPRLARGGLPDRRPRPGRRADRRRPLPRRASRRRGPALALHLGHAHLGPVRLRDQPARVACRNARDLGGPADPGDRLSRRDERGDRRRAGSRRCASPRSGSPSRRTCSCSTSTGCSSRPASRDGRSSPSAWQRGSSPRSSETRQASSRLCAGAGEGRGRPRPRGLLSPLVAGSLERALTLAEAMETRGFGRAGRPGRRDRRGRDSTGSTLVAAMLLALGALWL